MAFIVVRPLAAIRALQQGEDAVAAFIRNPPNSGPGKAISDSVRRTCDAYTVVPPWLRNLPFTSAGALGRVCKPYLDDQGASLPVRVPGVTGGQCAGVMYRCFLSVTSANPDTAGQRIETDRGVFPGPITERENPTPPLDCASVGSFNRRHSFVAGNGAVVAQLNACSSVAPDGATMRCVRVSGTEPPGGCGDGPPKLRPGPTPRPPVVIPPGEEPTQDPDDPTGFPRIPVPFFDDPIGGPTPVNPGDDGGGSGGDGGDRPDPGEPGAPVAPGPGGDAEGEAPPNSVLVGLRIEILEFPERAREYAPGVYRGVCYVYMGTEGLLDHDPAGAMLRADQFVYAERENLTHWRVSANNGYSLRVTPYYRELEAETV